MTTLNTLGVYLQTSQNFQVDEEQLRILLTSLFQRISYVVNVKDTGIYQTIEFLNSQTFFNNTNPQLPRNGFRKCFSIDAIASGATSTINHGITNITEFTRIYGTCVTDTPDYRPIPYASVTANANIEIRTTATQIVIANGAASPNITSGIVVLEYVKQ